MKKLLAVLLSTLLVLTLFSACKTNKEDAAPATNPPVETTTVKTDVAEKETVPETEKQEETKTTLPEATTEKNIPVTGAPVSDPTKAPETEPQQKPADITENRTNSPKVTQAVFDITKDEAKQIALGHAGLAETDIRYYKSELDRERNTVVYEIEFDAGKYEYDYEIDANSGKVIKAEKDFND